MAASIISCDQPTTENAVAKNSPDAIVTKYKMTTAIPKEITTPDQVNTRIGKLSFFDGFPDSNTTKLCYDNLDFMRGVEIFLNCMRGASPAAMRVGMREVGCVDGTIGIFENLMDSKSLFLTPNTETVYAMSWLDLKNGPVVVESPPNVLGIVDDFWFDYVTDMGNAGPDKGKGGKFLFLPPGYKGEIPKGYYTFSSPTFGNVMFWRGFLVNGDPKPAVENFKKNTHVYLLSQSANPPQTKFINLSGKELNTIHANNYHFFEEVNQIVQEEPAEAVDVETLGLLASIGIEKGKPFAPDERMKKILTDAAAVGNATARSIVFSSRIKDCTLYPNSQWQVGFIGGSHEFLNNGVKMLDPRTRMFYYATGITPAMAAKMIGVGSQYALAFRDANGNGLDGSKTYKLHIPPNPPAKNFWSIVIYDNQTRSELQTDQQFPSINSQDKELQKNRDGSVDIYFAPKAPSGKESNWIQSIPGKGFNVILRLYGPLEPWFNKTWKPGEIEPA